MDSRGLGAALRSEARATDQRRLVVLAGARSAGYEAAAELLEGAGIDRSQAALVGPDDRLGLDRVSTARASELLGTTNEAIVVDLHDALRPNAIGATVGAVDGGGLYVLLTPPLDAWPEQRDEFDERITAPPFSVDGCTGHFRRRFVRTLRRCKGVALVDVDAGEITADGIVNPAPKLDTGDTHASTEADHAASPFPEHAFELARTADQEAAVAALDVLAGDDPAAVVVKADRGRGKSSAAGLAAGALAADGKHVVVTAPAIPNAQEVFDRARELLDRQGARTATDPESEHQAAAGAEILHSTSGGSVRFLEPVDAVDLVDDAGESLPATTPEPDAVIVDEAAALPVRRLEALAAADRVAFATTTYGYEGTGRGFSVRFRDYLDDSRASVIDVRLDEPIRFAPGDPIETWAFDALLLNASPVPGAAIDDADPATARYEALDPVELRDDDPLLRSTFGLLVLAHYRTEPDDLARLLDAPNVAVRALTVNGHVGAVAMLAREGGLGSEIRAAAYDGQRIRGNMLPDVLLTQLRDEDAGRPIGARVVRIATHPAVRERGLGSLLLQRIREEAENGVSEWADAPQPADLPPGDGLDWVGVGFGATPRLVRFWARNGYRTLHCSTTRNDRSGEHSALMLDPLSQRGSDLLERTTERFARRIGGVCAGPLEDADPDVLRAVLAATETAGLPEPMLSDWEWSVVASAAYGPGIAAVAPSAFRELAVAWLLRNGTMGPGSEHALDDRAERLLVRGAIQGHPWSAVATELSYPSKRACLRAFGDAFEPIVEAFGTDEAFRIRDRYTEN